MNNLRLALRMLRREWHSGELRVMWLALLVAVAAVVAVGVFSDRVQQALSQQANAMLGGDLVMEADQPIPDSYRHQADQQATSPGAVPRHPDAGR